MEEETWWVGESLHLGFRRERETAPLFPLSQRQHKVRLSPFLECSYLFFLTHFLGFVLCLDVFSFLAICNLRGLALSTLPEQGKKGGSSEQQQV